MSKRTATATKLPNGKYEVIANLPNGRAITGIASEEGGQGAPEWALSPNLRDLPWPDVIKDIACALTNERDASA